MPKYEGTIQTQYGKLNTCLNSSASREGENGFTVDVRAIISGEVTIERRRYEVEASVGKWFPDAEAQWRDWMVRCYRSSDKADPDEQDRQVCASLQEMALEHLRTLIQRDVTAFVLLCLREQNLRAVDELKAAQKRMKKALEECEKAVHLLDVIEASTVKVRDRVSDGQ